MLPSADICMIGPLGPWGNKNWPSSVKEKKLENFLTKGCPMECKWSSLGHFGCPCYGKPSASSTFCVERIPLKVIKERGSVSKSVIMLIEKQTAIRAAVSRWPMPNCNVLGFNGRFVP